MSSVGETLRRERLRKELSLEQISRETKISARLLDAIEQDQYERLPGGVFAKSFARQYARFLGLDEEGLAAEVEKAVSPATDLPSFATPAEPAFKVPRVTEWDGGSRSTSSLLPALAGVVAVMLVCSALYAWWLRSRHPAPPVQGTSLARSASAAPVRKASEPAPVPPTVAGAPETPSKTELPPSDGTPAAESGAGLHVSLAVDSNVWVHVWADNKSILEGVLQPGAEKAFDAADAIRIRTGNAGDLHVTVNGKPAGDLGPKGQIRIVEVTAKGVQILPPSPKPAPAVPAPEPL
ncbi:MAG: RodZ domain-containing protein [Bryobacteraceae bacterium]|jgi:cytoskeletal protein RodZ